MKISTRGQYSLEALLCLAVSSGDKPRSIRAISEQSGISDGYLEQLFIPLKKKGLVIGSRGVQGGYALAKDPSRISAGDVLRAVETSLHPVPCVQGGYCKREKSCASRRTWKTIDSALEEVLNSVKISDLIMVYRGLSGEVV